jgi:hypothetical protein
MRPEIKKINFRRYKIMKITGVKKAVGTYKRANSGGYYCSSYGALMVDMSKGYVWCDEFSDRFSYIAYDDENIARINLEGEPATMQNVKAIAERMCAEHIA